MGWQFALMHRSFFQIGLFCTRDDTLNMDNGHPVRQPRIRSKLQAPSYEIFHRPLALIGINQCHHRKCIDKFILNEMSADAVDLNDVSDVGSTSVRTNSTYQVDVNRHWINAGWHPRNIDQYEKKYWPNSAQWLLSQYAEYWSTLHQDRSI